MRTTSCHEWRDLAANTCYYQWVPVQSDPVKLAVPAWKRLCTYEVHRTVLLVSKLRVWMKRRACGTWCASVYVTLSVSLQDAISQGWNVTATLIILTRSSFCLGDTVKRKQNIHERKFQTNDTVRVCEASVGLAHVTNVGTISVLSAKKYQRRNHVEHDLFGKNGFRCMTWYLQLVGRPKLFNSCHGRIGNI